MRETTWIIDEYSGNLIVEGLNQAALKNVAPDLLPSGDQVNCARPVVAMPLKISPAVIALSEPSIRVFRIYHNSVVEGPGRRSVLQTAGCKMNICVSRLSTYSLLQLLHIGDADGKSEAAIGYR